MFGNLFNTGGCGCVPSQPTVTNDCGCSPAQETTVKCPHCGLEGSKVSALTVESQLKEEKLNDLSLASRDSFNFCDAANCPVVYYSDDQKETFKQEDIKNPVSIKNEDLDTPLCYCRNLTKRDVVKMIENNEKDIVRKIRTMLFNGACNCEQTNPRGISCTEDITIFLLKYGIVYDTNTEAYKEYEIMKKLTSCCGGGNIKVKENNSCCS